MRRIFTYGGYFEKFIESLSDDVVKKIDYVISLLKTQERLSEKFVKYVEDGIYELRIHYEGCVYRIFFIFDNGNIVVLFNGFKKKSQKTPKKEIEMARTIKNAYYETRK